jgi:hypothetical protein
MNLEEQQASNNEPVAKKPKIRRPATHLDLNAWLSEECEPESRIEWLAKSYDLTPSWAYLFLLDVLIENPQYAYAQCSQSKKWRAFLLLKQWLSRSSKAHKEDDHHQQQQGGEKEDFSSGGDNVYAPTLQRLCAQRLAMELFPKALETMKKKKRDSRIGKIDAMKELVAASTMIPSFFIDEDLIHKEISDELFIFLIVYELHHNLRKLDVVPTSPIDFNVPIDDNDPDDYWWVDDSGIWGTSGCIPLVWPGSNGQVCDSGAFSCCKPLENEYCAVPHFQFEHGQR